MKFKELNLDIFRLSEYKTITPFDGVEIKVRQCLPINEKTDLISYILAGSIDENTGTSSPVREKIFRVIAIARWYTDIEFSDEDLVDNITDTYDKLVSSGLMEAIILAMPSEEAEDICTLSMLAINSVEKYLQSFAGVISDMSKNTSQLDEQLNSILEQIRNKEGLEQLDAIKGVVGMD